MSEVAEAGGGTGIGAAAKVVNLYTILTFKDTNTRNFIRHNQVVSKQSKIEGEARKERSSLAGLS